MKKYVFGLLIVISIISLTSCNSKTDPSPSEASSVEQVGDDVFNITKAQFTSSEMELGQMEMKPFSGIVKANGMFDVPPDNEARVSTYFGGTVKSIQLIPGQRVKKGQILFVLENPDYVQIQQDYLEAKGHLTYLKSDFDRQKNLVQDNVASQKTFLKSESEYTVTRVRLESLGKKLVLMGINPNTLAIENIRTTINIHSPISGFVTHVDIAKGIFLIPSQNAITIVNTDHLHLELNIFEKDLMKVKIGQPIVFKIQEDNSKEYKATVHMVNKTVDPEKRTINIHGHIIDEGQSAKFNPGMYVEAEILTTSEIKASLPEDALVDSEGKYYVLVLSNTTKEGYTFIKKEVKTGSTKDGFVEILNMQNFKDNSKFLIRGAFNLIK